MAASYRMWGIAGTPQRPPCPASSEQSRYLLDFHLLFTYTPSWVRRARISRTARRTGIPGRLLQGAMRPSRGAHESIVQMRCAPPLGGASHEDCGMLTPRQHTAYEFIVGFLGREGFAPSYEEIRRHLGLRSLNAVSKLIAQLRRRGALAAAPFNAKRSLTLVAGRGARSLRSVGARGRDRTRPPATVPLLGLIAAG